MSSISSISPLGDADTQDDDGKMFFWFVLVMEKGGGAGE